MNDHTPKDPKAAFTINGVPYTADGVPVEEAGKRRRKGEKRPFLAIKAPNSGVQAPSSRYSGAATRQPDAAKRPANTRKAATARKPDKKRQPASTRQSGANPQPANAADTVRSVIALGETRTAVIAFLTVLIAIIVLALAVGAYVDGDPTSALDAIEGDMFVCCAGIAIFALIVIRMYARNMERSRPWGEVCWIASTATVPASASGQSKRRALVPQMTRIARLAAREMGISTKHRTRSGNLAAVLCAFFLIMLLPTAVTGLVDYLDTSGSPEASSSSDETTAAVTADEDTLATTLQEIGGKLQEVCADVYVEDPEENPDSATYTVSGYVDDEWITEVIVDLNADGSFDELLYVIAVDPDDDLEDAIDRASEQLAQLRDALAQTSCFQERPELVEMSSLPDDFLDQFRDVGGFEEDVYYDEDFDGGYNVFACYSNESDGKGSLTLSIELYD